MMELTCAFLLISASLVLATPHGYGGYGVKGGASARAESSASAGAFGGVPVAVPLGAGYSGSFSKSSSSSSASSSASSSSSSSAFSYSGSGAGGFGLNGGAPGHGGCSSGDCKTDGGNGIPAPHGSSAQGYSSANAAAAAGAGAVLGSGCQGLSCDGNSEKCKSGQCKPDLPTGTPSIDSDSTKCTSGQCGSALGNGASLTDHGSNDIRTVTESSDSTHNANHQSSGIDKTSSAYNGAGSDCSHGKCGPSGPSSSKPGYYGHDSGNSFQGSSVSNNQQASSSDTEISSHYQKPSTHLETPKIGSKCNSGNCNAGPNEPGHETSPSSYNVPIHGAYDKGEPKPSCDGVKCENQPKGENSPTSNSVTKGPSSLDYPSSINCAGSGCFGIPANQVSGRPSFTASPGSINFGTPANTATGGPSLTVRPGNVNFGNSPSNPHTVPAGSNAAPGHDKSSDANNKLPNDKLPPYTGGFGGPAGILTPNEYNFHAPTANPSNGHVSTPQNVKPFASVSTGCNSPSCSGFPSTSGPTGGPVPTGTYNHRPSGDISSEKLPLYTGGFGGPTGMLKPNEFDVHATVTNKPIYAHPGTPSYNTQSPVGNIGTQGCQAGGNCGGYSPTAGATSGASAPYGYYGTTKPTNGITSPNDKQPMYTGGFGGPGFLNPDKHNIHSTGPSSPGYSPSGTYNSPASSGNPGVCKTPNCSPSLGSTAAANAHAESFGVTKPSTGPHLSSITSPAYPSGYDRPSAVHSPNEISGPASIPSFTHTQVPSSPGSYTPGCKTGNCANYPSSGPSVGATAQPGSYGIIKPNLDVKPAGLTHPQYTGGLDGPAGTFNPNEYTSSGCKTGNCANYPTSGPSAGANAQAGSFGATKPNTDVKPTSPTPPQYTGGFGGPSGTFNANEHTSPGCKTGNCANYPTSGPSAGANAQAGSFGVTKPNTDVKPADSIHPQYTGGFGGPSGTFNANEHTSTGCKTGNCANYPTSGPSAGANAQAGSFGFTKPNTDVKPADSIHPQYTGGFGGPSGTYNPNEHTSSGCKTGNCANYPTSGPSAGANAQAGSFGVTKPNIDVKPAGPTHPQYTGGFGGPSGTFNANEHTSSGCKTGNCANYPTSGPSAGANAQAGSFGFTKPNTDVKPAGSTHPQYTSGFGGPAGTYNPNEHTSSGCKTGNCANYPTSGPSAGANAQAGSFGVTKPNTDLNPGIPTHPQYTGGFGGPSGTFKPNEQTYVTPSTGSFPTNCKTPNCDGSATSSADAISGSYGITKPSSGNNPSDEKPIYQGGFGGAAGLLKPNEYTMPVVSPTTPVKNPTGASTPAACTSGKCNPQTPHGSAPHSQNGASSGTHATAAAGAEANAVAYTGGFGGPPGVLTPYDDGKIGALPSSGSHGPQIGGAHGSHNANLANSQHGTITGANGSPTGLAGAHGSTGAHAGSNAGATAYAGAAAGASAGAHGYNPHGSNYNPAGNVKGGGAYNGGSTLGVSGGQGFPKLVFSDGLNGAGSTSGAAAKSLSGANAFGAGGSFASSSASAHASAGAYTKGGYGKR